MATPLLFGGAQNGADGQDITTLMAKVAVGLEYVHQQQQPGTPWSFGQEAQAPRHYHMP